MAVYAGHPAGLVRAALPEHMATLPVAGEAGMVLPFRRFVGRLGEPHGKGLLGTARFHVCFAWPVAGFATELFIRGARLGKDFAHYRVFETIALIFVTDDTSVRTHILGLSG